MADQLLFLARCGLYATLAPLFGIPAFLLIGPPGARHARIAAWLPGIAVGSGLVAIVLSAVQLAALAASMGGMPVSAVDAATLGMLLASGATGTAWMLRVGALAAGMLLAAALRGRPRLAAPLAVTGAVALGSCAWSGHGAVDPGAAGWVHLAADVLHLLAAGLWAGALLVFVHVLARDPGAVDRGHLALCAEMLTGFAATGTALVAVLVVTGIANGAFLIDRHALSHLAGDGYGRLLLLKLAAFLAMLALAGANRWRLTPALGRASTAGEASAAFGRLRRSILVETLVLLAVFALVARLGMLPPTGTA